MKCSLLDGIERQDDGKAQAILSLAQVLPEIAIISGGALFIQKVLFLSKETRKGYFFSSFF